MRAKDEAVIEVQQAEMKRTMEEIGVPAHLRAGLSLYILHGYPPGSFLASVLRNDLSMAVQHADPASFNGLRELVRWLKWHAPAAAHGGYENYRTWQIRGGLNCQ